MAGDRQVIAVAGVGHLGRYICEELLAAPDFDIIVLSRQSNTTSWASKKGIPTHPTDYTPSSLLSILNQTNATTLISFINLTSPLYIQIHSALLSACQQSTHCKRLIPSEWIGDIESYPLKPEFYGTTREPFRQALRAQDTVKWTLFNNGWLADYFLPESKTHMPPIPDEFPVDANGWRAFVRGTGEEVQSWTCGRDVGKAIVELCRADEWEPVTYVAAEWSTFNTAIKVMEEIYDQPMPRTNKPWEKIRETIEAHKGEKELSPEAEIAQVEEMMVMSYLACPKEKTLRQREKYFRNVSFRGLRQLLLEAKEVDFV